MFTITARYGFEAAHRLHNPSWSNEKNTETFGPCNTIHGHSYRLEVSVSRDSLIDGMVVDFSALDAIVTERIVSRLDHSLINDLPEMSDITTTAEEVAQWIWNEIKPGIEELGVTLSEVHLFESPQYSVRITSD